MVAELISEFEDALAQVASAIDGDDHSQIAALDAVLVECWNKILAYAPEDKNSRRALAEFLVKQLTSGQEMSVTQLQAKDRLIGLTID